jgi:hypothetical protein
MPVPRGFAVKNASKRPDRRGLSLSWRHFLVDATLGLLCSIDFCGLSSIGLGRFAGLARHGPRPATTFNRFEKPYRKRR